MVSIVDKSRSSSIYTLAPTRRPTPSSIFVPSGLLGHFDTFGLGQLESSVVF